MTDLLATEGLETSSRDSHPDWQPLDMVIGHKEVTVLVAATVCPLAALHV